MNSALLCLALLLDHGPTPMAARGCALAPHAVDAADARVPADLLLAVAWRETGWRAGAQRGVMCGAWQILAYGGDDDCARYKRPADGAREAHTRLAGFLRRAHGRLPHALELYAGCKSGCAWYARQVQEAAARWR